MSLHQSTTRTKDRLILLLSLAVSRGMVPVEYIYDNDIPTATNDLTIMFTPKCCNHTHWTVNYESMVTFSCTRPLKRNEFFEFHGDLAMFPYFMDTACFIEDYVPKQNISTC